ncbi:MAG: hypothetical protein Q7T53_07315 [Deltaproteobacteria bacterium]|nr:hypothetical protein [Deltaproteobacteria bacterium]
MVKISLKVETYSGYKADERPVSFTLVNRRFQVREIVDQWYGVDHTYYKLIADDSNLYIIRHDREMDEWEMVMMEAAPEKVGL